jgi:hypothetical protein
MRLWLCVALAACGGSKASSTADAPVTQPDGPTTNPDAPGFADTLDGNRDRLLATYYAWLEADPDTKQSNGLTGHDLHSVCDLWNGLDPSAQNTFRTITHRLWGATLADGTHALSHVTKLYRVIGGEGATATDPGTCGGGEYNRLIMQQDMTLHAAQLAANMHKGAQPYDLADITTYWRDSHDLGGPHAPFDLSDETNDGAPRGQTQYFKDPASAVANTALGRRDLMTLVDPYALEMDQDYDCAHSSNPDCSYTLYGPVCAPETSEAGTQLYTGNYGDFEPAYKPAGC